MTANTTQTLTRPERKTEPKAKGQAIIAGTRPPRDSSAGDVVLAYLRLQAHALKTLEPRARADEFDAVHQMRVATRRLRAALRTFGHVTGAEHLAGELRWLGRDSARPATARCSPGTCATACARSRPSCSSGRSRPACRATNASRKGMAARHPPQAPPLDELEAPPLNELGREDAILANELGPKNTVSNTEIGVLPAVRAERESGSVAGTMRHSVLVTSRSGAQ